MYEMFASKFCENFTNLRALFSMRDRSNFTGRFEKVFVTVKGE